MYFPDVAPKNLTSYPVSSTPTVNVLDIEDPKANVVSPEPKVSVTPLEPSSAFILPDCSNKISTLLVPSPM